MTVDSYLELFTTLFGWTFYNILWDVLVGTGIVFLPFLGILIDNWRRETTPSDLRLRLSTQTNSEVAPEKAKWSTTIFLNSFQWLSRSLSGKLVQELCGADG